MPIPSFVHGPIANVFTAFNAEGGFDPDGQRAMLDYLIGLNACSALFVRSGMGQMYTYSYDDTTAMIDLAVDHTAGRLPVIAGTAGIWQRNLDQRANRETYFRESIELSQYAEAAGVQGIVLVLPEAVVPNDGESIAAMTLAYCDAVHDATKGPIFLYQPPPITEPYRFTPALITEIAKRERIVAAKISTNDAYYLFECQCAVRDLDFKLIAGAETAYYSALGMGIDAVIGQGCCINPQILCAEGDAFARGDLEAAMHAQHMVNKLVKEIPSPIEFLKRYATDKGFAVPPYSRQEEGGAYGNAAATQLTDSAYAAGKALLEATIAEFS